MQSQSPHAHGSVPFRSRQRLRACASCTLSSVKYVLPVLALFVQRRRAVADLDPLHAAVVELTRRLHVAQVLVAGDRARGRAFRRRSRVERGRAARLHPRGDQVAHVRAARHCPARSTSMSDRLRPAPSCRRDRWAAASAASAQRSRIGMTQRHAASTASRRMNSVASPAITSRSSRS